MKFNFKKTKRDSIIKKITAAMGDRAITKLVSFEMNKTGLKVTISKLGKSTLEFEESKEGEDLCYTLCNQKIAFAHKAFKDEFTQKIIKIIKKAGGKHIE